MSVPQINAEKIFNAITSQRLPAAATELGAELVDAWVSECATHDQAYKTLLLEAGFYIPLGAKTWVVGACDRVMSDGDGVLFEESKSTANKKSKTYGPWEWFETIQGGHQIGVYGAALSRGSFIITDEILPLWAGIGLQDGSGETSVSRFSINFEKGGMTWKPDVTNPRVLVRAVTKFKPPEIWPSPAGAIIDISPAKIDATVSVCCNAAESIRAMRKTGRLPWALPTHGCTKVYGFSRFPCEFLAQCNKHEYGEGLADVKGLSPGSSDVVQYLVSSGQIDPKDPETVVLSSSSLEDAMWCYERWRRRSLGQEREEKEAFDIGTILHVGLAEYRRQMQKSGF